jgi:hypothetical protein
MVQVKSITATTIPSVLQVVVEFLEWHKKSIEKDQVHVITQFVFEFQKIESPTFSLRPPTIYKILPMDL